MQQEEEEEEEDGGGGWRRRRKKEGAEIWKFSSTPNKKKIASGPSTVSRNHNRNPQPQPATAAPPPSLPFIPCFGFG
ncbi:uncharacterized protein LAJ45_00769 [Morchella importuna]|uniref:uncharacterized protein n=1 Tax=Morchella importuna TaxID=1174673 RepID=UPI001E8E3BAC|nr:uncharacterized protein LAJ45_00769 [Morchella importuna]KAH8155759.1 hypothetical protein LAJ45_00769 [Morchella importuna]